MKTELEQKEIKYNGVWTPQYLSTAIAGLSHQQREKMLASWAADIVEVNINSELQLKIEESALHYSSEYLKEYELRMKLHKENERLKESLNKIDNLIGNYMHNDSVKIGTLVLDIQEIAVKT